MDRYIVLFISIVFLTGCANSERKAKKAELSVVEGLKIGNRAPELANYNPEGTLIPLSSLRGKIVLIDFWASWCLPCRRENPSLVNTYKRYKDKNFKNNHGFTIYSVSCDREKQAWINAIEQDNLFWENHVSDLKGWNAEAAIIYNINTIPSSILIDGNGIILAWNLRGEQLSQMLESLLE
ncbi:Thiol-disulfide oxidoreductase ResA [subsurface metagenome]